MFHAAVVGSTMGRGVVTSFGTQRNDGFQKILMLAVPAWQMMT